MRGNLSFAGADAESSGGGPRGIPVAHVRGTLGDPDVEVTPEAARRFAAVLDPTRLGAKLERAVGKDTARELADGIGNLLQKASPKRR